MYLNKDLQLPKCLLELFQRLSHLDTLREDLIDKNVPEDVKRGILKEVLDE
jgi:hypothetical protein